MRHAGFIFSLDAFVAFTLIMVTISMLIFVIGTPKPYYSSLEQAHQLAYDTLSALATSSDAPAHPTYLEQIMGGENAKPIMFKVAGGSENYSGMIPKGFGYRLEKYNFQQGNWAEAYDAGKDCNGTSPYGTYPSRGILYSDRCGKSFTKLQASATTFTSIYIDPYGGPRPGKSPYCYLNCFGYVNPGNTHKDPCDAVPCNVSKWNFYPGNNSIGLIRLVVYT